MSAAPIDRRALLAAGGLAATGLAVGRAAPAAAAGKKARIDLSTTAGGLTALVKVSGSLDPKQQTLLFSHGTGYAVDPTGRTMEPWFRVFMLIAIRNLPAEEGYRQMSNQLFLFGHPTEDRIIEEWANPVTGKTLPVFHGHNGPMNIELKPYQMRLGADANVKEKVPFNLPWKLYGGMASLSTELKSRRPNVLDASWGDAFTGPFVQSVEWTQWTAIERELTDPDVPSVIPVGTITRHAGWYPWMMMGDRPGSFLTHMTGTKIAGLDGLPPFARAYAEAHYPAYLSAPAEWTGSYVDLMTVYKRERAPR